MSVLKENTHLTVKFPSDIVRLYKCNGYAQLFVRARLKKKKKKKKKKYIYIYIYIYTKNYEKRKSSLLLRYAFHRCCGSSGIAKCFY